MDRYKAKVAVTASAELIVSIRESIHGDIEIDEVIEILEVDDIDDIEIITKL